MAFDELKENTDEIRINAEAYLKKSVAYYKLWGFKVAMKSTTMIFKFVLIAMSLTMVLFFFSVAAGFAIASLLDSYALGFLCVGVFYLIITALIFLIKDKIVEGTLLEKFSEIFFND